MISSQLLFIMGIALLFILPMVMLILHSIDRKDRSKVNIGSSLTKKNNSGYYYSVYLRLRKTRLIRSYIDRISRYYELIYPGDAYHIAKKTIQTTVTTLLSCTVAMAWIIAGRMNYINTVVAMLLVYVINTEVLGFMVSKTESRLLEDISLFISNVRHNFYIKYMVDDAILLSGRGVKNYEMQVHVNKLYEIVTASDVREAVENYNATMHNKYLKMFLSLCVNVMEYSDRIIKGQSLFISNLDNLKKEIEAEEIKLKRLRFKFSGITFMTIAVCVPFDMIRSYGISMVPELDSFYDGKGGYIYVTVTILTALGIYLLNNQLKGANRQLPGNHTILKILEKRKVIKKILDNYLDKHNGRMLELKLMFSRVGESISVRQFILKRMIFAFAVGLSLIIFAIYLHNVNRDNIVNETVLPASITILNSKQAAIMQDKVIGYVTRYKSSHDIDIKKMLSTLSGEKAIHNDSERMAIAEEIVSRIRRYHNEYFKWYELLICLGLSGVAYSIPYWLILYKKKVLQLSMEEEVNQLNSIIFMLMYSEHITVKDLLEEMELFAVVFRQTIQECINDYNSGDINALEQMKDKERFGPFIRLVDNLIRCDAINISKAFDEIAKDRENYHERRKLENEISVQKRADRAQLMAWIPSILVMIYLTIPLLVTALDALSTFQEMVQSI